MPTKKVKRETSTTVTEGASDFLRSRIVGHADVHPSQLKAHNMNFRRHPEYQKKALRLSLDELGWIKSVIVSKRTNTILDGHARVEDALERGLKSVPVEYVDVSEEEERKALAVIDPLTEMAQKDSFALQALVDSIKMEHDELGAVIKKLVPLNNEAVLDKKPVFEGILEYTTDVYFPTESKYGIPEFKADMLYEGPIPSRVWAPEQKDAEECELLRWGTTGIDHRFTNRIPCFYADDDKFENIWEESVMILKQVISQKPRAFVSPDFSLWCDEPIAVQMYNFYRSRWVARYWQEAGLKCIPSFASSLKPDVYDFIFEGIPEGCPIMATQLLSGGMKRRDYVEAILRDIRELIARVHPQNLILYSTSPRQILEPLLPPGTNYHWVASFNEQRTLLNKAAGKRK